MIKDRHFSHSFKLNKSINRKIDAFNADRLLCGLCLIFKFLDWKNKEIEKIKKLEYQTQSTKQPVSIKGVYFTIDGFIQFERMRKVPVLNHEHRKIIALLTCMQDITLQLG